MKLRKYFRVIHRDLSFFFSGMIVIYALSGLFMNHIGDFAEYKVIEGLKTMHYNMGSWWTMFSDIFVVSLLVITFTGLFMNKGKHGILGRGGVELIIGILVPLLLYFFL